MFERGGPRLDRKAVWAHAWKHALENGRRMQGLEGVKGAWLRCFTQCFTEAESLCSESRRGTGRMAS